MILPELYEYRDYAGNIFHLRQKDEYEPNDVVICKIGEEFDEIQPRSQRPYNTRFVRIRRLEQRPSGGKRYVPYDDNGSYLYYNAIAGLADDFHPVFPPRPAVCNRCGAPYDREQHSDEDGLCPFCAKRDYILPYHRYYPHPIFYTKATDRPLYLGVELEVDCGGESDRTVKQIYRKFPDLQKFCYFSHDGSLGDGFEIIFHPMDLEVYKENAPLFTAFFDYLRSLGYLSHNTNTCGLHIHINRDYFKTERQQEVGLSKMLFVWEKYWSEILLFSRRISKAKVERFAKKLDEPIRSFITRWNKTNEHDGHYYSVNLTNEKTIEFRIFKGTLNINTFYATLEFINNLVKISSSKTVTELTEIPFDAYLSDLSARYYAVRKGDSIFEEIEVT